MVPCSSVSFSGQYITAERGPFVGDVSTTDGHGQARKHDTYILVSVQFREFQWSDIPVERCFSAGDDFPPRTSTDGHGTAGHTLCKKGTAFFDIHNIFCGNVVKKVTFPKEIAVKVAYTLRKCGQKSTISDKNYLRDLLVRSQPKTRDIINKNQQEITRNERNKNQ